MNGCTTGLRVAAWCNGVMNGISLNARKREIMSKLSSPNALRVPYRNRLIAVSNEGQVSNEGKLPTFRK